MSASSRFALTMPIESYETTLRKDVKLRLSSGSKLLLHKPPHLIGKLRRARIRLTALVNDIGRRLEIEKWIEAFHLGKVG